MDLPDNPSIELVATKLRDLRRTAQVLSASPELLRNGDDELRSVLDEYDHWLLAAARQVDVEVAPIAGDGTLLPAATRRVIEHRVAERGWAFDGEPS